MPISNPLHLFTPLLRKGLLALLFAFLFLPSSSASAQTNSATLSGRVINLRGEPVADVSVRLHTSVPHQEYPNGYWSVAHTVKTNTNGEYTFASLSPNTYRLTYVASSTVYEVGTYNRKGNFDSADSILVSDGATLTGYDLVLDDVGHIVGTVVDVENNPIAGITVDAKSVDSMFPLNFSVAAVTDEDGKFTLYLKRDNLFALSLKDTQGRYLTEFYNDQMFGYLAQTITLGTNEVFTVTIPLSRPKTILGRVTDNFGVPLSNIPVRLDDINNLGSYYAATDQDGAYRFANLRKGLYGLDIDGGNIFVGEDYNNGNPRNPALTIDYSGDSPETTVVEDVTLTRRSIISGTVTDGNGNPLPKMKVYLYRWSTYSGKWGSVDNESTKADGTYQFVTSGAGQYLVKFGPSKKFVTEYYNNSPTVNGAQPISVTGDVVVANVNAQLEKFGIITGTVTTPEGQPIAGVQLDAYPRFPSGKYPETYLSTSTNAAGYYELALAPGIAFAVGLVHSSYDAEYYDDQPSVNTAATFSLPLGVVVPNINMQLRLGPKVSGRVTDNSGAALAGIDVEIIKLVNYANIYDEFTHAKLKTDEQGYYAIGLAAGEYKFQFTDPSGNHDPFYYPATSSPYSQPRFVLPPGEDLTIDTQLRIIPSLSGSVTTQSGEYGYADVILIKGVEIEGKMQWPCCRAANTKTTGTLNGDYRFQNITPGEYIVKFSPDVFMNFYQEYYPNQRTVDTATIFTVTASSIFTDINAVLDKQIITPPTGPVEADFSATPTTGSGRLNVSFTSLAQGPVTSYFWDFGDGTVGSRANTSHTYTRVGVYTVILTVTGASNSDSETKASYISVTDTPIEQLSIQQNNPGENPDTQPTVGETLYFSAIASGSNVEFLWDFGDTSPSIAATAVGQYAQYTYSAPGTYLVSLTARNGVDEQVTTLPVIVAEAPAEEIPIEEVPTEEPPTEEPPTEEPPAEEPAAEETPIAAVPTEEPVAEETPVTETPVEEPVVEETPVAETPVEEPSGEETPVAETPTVESPVEEPTGEEPTNVEEVAVNGLFVNGPTIALINQAVSLNAAVAAGSNVSYTWDFGDGTSGTGEVVSHAYTAAGSYTVTLTASNAQGEVQVTSAIIVNHGLFLPRLGN